MSTAPSTPSVPAMSRRRRLLLCGAGLVAAALVLAARSLALVLAVGGDRSERFASTDSAMIVSYVNVTGPGVGSILGALVPLLLLTLVVYTATLGIKPDGGAVSVFVLGWAGMVLASVAAQLVTNAIAGDSGVAWFAWAPFPSSALFGLSSHAGTSSLLLGWSVGVALVIAYRLSRPKVGAAPAPNPEQAES